MDIDLTGLTEAELIELNHRVVERIRVLRLACCRSTMGNFNVGDRVSFRPDCGHEVTGTIVRLNVKSVTLVGAEGRRWRVSPALLTKNADPPRPDDAANIQGILIDLATRQQRDRGKA